VVWFIPMQAGYDYDYDPDPGRQARSQGLRVRVTREDLGACIDILLENVFAHTPDGAALAVRLSRRAAGGVAGGRRRRPRFPGRRPHRARPLLSRTHIR